MTDRIDVVRGRIDRIPRRVFRAPKLDPYECPDAYSPMLYEIQPGKWDRRIIALDRVESVDASELYSAP